MYFSPSPLSPPKGRGRGASGGRTPPGDLPGGASRGGLPGEANTDRKWEPRGGNLQREENGPAQPSRPHKAQNRSPPKQTQKRHACLCNREKADTALAANTIPRGRKALLNAAESQSFGKASPLLSTTILLYMKRLFCSRPCSQSFVKRISLELCAPVVCGSRARPPLAVGSYLCRSSGCQKNRTRAAAAVKIQTACPVFAKITLLRLRGDRGAHFGEGKPYLCFAPPTFNIEKRARRKV